MTESDRILAQHNEITEPTVNPSVDHPVSVGIGAVSGGLAGAAIGRFVAGRLGAAIGAVVGGVAGAAISNEKSEEISHAVEGAVDAAKEKAQEVKPSVMNALDQAKSKVETINPAAANAVDTIKNKIDDATARADSDENYAQNSDAQSLNPSFDASLQNSSAQNAQSGYPVEAEYVRDGAGSDYTHSNSAYSDSTYVSSAYVEGQTTVQDLDAPIAPTADDLYSAGDINSAAAYVEDSSFSSSTSASTGYADSDASDAGAGYADTGYTDVGYTEPPMGYVADDIYSPNQPDFNSAYIEEQPPSLESLSPTGYDSNVAYSSSDNINSDTSVEEQYDLGVTLGKQGDLTGSIAAFQSVIASEPNYAEAHYNLGVVLCKYGLTEQGVAHMEQSRGICQSQGRAKEAENIDRILQSLDA